MKVSSGQGGFWMKCYTCGRELDDKGICSYCADGAKVRVLSREEKNFYDGVTIEETPEGTREEGPRFYKRDRFREAGIRFHQIHLGSPKKNWLNWVIGGVVLAAILAIVLFVALPIALVLAAVAAVVWVFLSFFQGL